MGRRWELAALVGAVDGGAPVVLVVGDAGIGKTRLVGELLRDVEARGHATATAGCLPLAETLPLLPVADLIAALDGPGDGSLEHVLARLPEYVRIELGRLLPHLASDTAGGTTHRSTFFSAVSALVQEVASHGPLALVVEDVQWADAPTLDVLTYLVAHLGGNAMSLVVTCRSSGVPAHVEAWLTTARHVPGSVEIRLGPLTRAEVTEQVADLLGGPADDALVEELHARAEGNPFFTEQLLDSRQRAGRVALPRGLADELAERVRRVDADARSALSALAVAERPLPESLIAEITGLGGAPLFDALRSLGRDGLVAATEDGVRYRIDHSLLAEAARGELLPGERAALHERVAATLEGLDDSSLAAETAGHWRAAGRPDRELPATVTAAAVAQRVLAFSAAAELWRRASVLAADLPKVAADLDVDPVRLGVRAIDALDAAGRDVEAAEVAERTLESLDDCVAPAVRATVHARAAAFRATRDPAAARKLLDEGLRLFDADATDSPEHAEALRLSGSLDSCLGGTGNNETARRSVRRAMEMARRVGATGTEARSLAQLAHLDFVAGDVDGGFAVLEQARPLAGRLAETTSDPEFGLWLAVNESDGLLELGHLDEARQIASAAMADARRGGRGDAWVCRILNANAAEASVELGDIAAAADLVGPLTTGDPHGGDWITHEWRAEVDLRHGQVDDAVRRLDAVLRFPLAGDVDAARELAQHVASVALWAGDPARALAEVQRAVVRLAGTEQDVFLGELLALGARAAADLAERSRARLDSAGASAGATALDGLADLATGLSSDPFAAHPFVVRSVADQATWRAERSRAAGSTDAGLWEEAALAWARLGRPHRAAYAWWRCGQIRLRSTGRPRDAADALDRAARGAIGHEPLLAEVTRLARRAHVPIAAEPPIAPAIPTQRRAYGLTEREGLVLGLVARGMTNAEIGARLYMSPKTASVHVTHIVRKMGVANRIEAAAVAERAGLLDAVRDL